MTFSIIHTLLSPPYPSLSPLPSSFAIVVPVARGSISTAPVICGPILTDDRDFLDRDPVVDDPFWLWFRRSRLRFGDWLAPVAVCVSVCTRVGGGAKRPVGGGTAGDFPSSSSLSAFLAADLLASQRSSIARRTSSFILLTLFSVRFISVMACHLSFFESQSL